MLLFVSMEKHYWTACYFENLRKRLGELILLPNVNGGTAGHKTDSVNLTGHVLFQHQRVASFHSCLDLFSPTLKFRYVWQKGLLTQVVAPAFKGQEVSVKGKILKSDSSPGKVTLRNYSRLVSE